MSGIQNMQEHMIQQQVKCFEDLLKQLYLAATGEELTVDNAHEIQLARYEFGDPRDQLLAIRGTVVGMITYYEDFSEERTWKAGYKFEPNRKSFTSENLKAS